MKPARERTSIPGSERLTIRWHGTGGFGATTAAMLLAEAVVSAGGSARAAVEAGAERRGAPLQAFTWIGQDPLLRRRPMERPDVVVILDPRLLAIPTVTADLTPRTWVVVNSPVPPAVRRVPGDQVITIDASNISSDIPNIAMLAAVVARFSPLEPRAFLFWLERRLGEEFWPEVVLINVRVAHEAMKQAPDRRLAVPA